MFNPKEFLDVARRLSPSWCSEAEYRTSISRSLYATFLWLREELDTHGQHVKVTDVNKTSDEHANVRNSFKIGQRYRHDGVKDRLFSLYQLRYKSDYHLEDQIEQADVIEALECADYIIDTCTKRFFPPT